MKDSVIIKTVKNQGAYCSGCCFNSNGSGCATNDQTIFWLGLKYCEGGTAGIIYKMGKEDTRGWRILDKLESILDDAKAHDMDNIKTVEIIRQIEMLKENIE